jgi:formylglycine-generating enzyme required for sulfatase activity
MGFFPNKDFAMKCLIAAVLLVGMAGMSLGEDTAKSAAPAPAPGDEVTLTGIVMSNWACTRDMAVFKKRDVEDKAPILFAFEGTPEVAAAFQEIFKELIAGNSINYEQAAKIEDEMNKRLKYWITPNDLTAAKENAVGGNSGGTFRAVTGVISEKDGKKWITPTKMANKPYKYPDGFLAPDKPLKKVGEKPLILKVTDNLSLKCILLPRGEIMFKVPFYSLPRWADEFPLHVTLTKPFWMAEIPVTQEMWDAAMGAERNFSTTKDPNRPAKNSPCKDINKFCQILAEKNGRIVRLPGEAEWEWAARVGTSNPPLMQKYKKMMVLDKSDPKGAAPKVKGCPPNPWGLYDMYQGGFEVTRDKGDLHFIHRRDDRVDPYDSCEADEAAGKKHAHWCVCPGDSVTYHETVLQLADETKRPADTAYGSTKVRVVVEATPEEIAEMEKAEKK